MSGRHLTISEREVISNLTAKGIYQAEIARQLGSHKSCISRELNRNKRVNGVYSPSCKHKLKSAALGVSGKNEINCVALR